MKRIVAMLAVLAVVTGVGLVVGGDVRVGRALEFKDAQKNEIEATVTLFDTGDPSTGLVVSGRGSGFDPNQTFLSLIYDVDSVDSGSKACVPTGTSLKPEQHFVGFWEVDADGTARLNAIKMGQSHAELRRVGTLSIRQNVFGVNELVKCARVSLLSTKPPERQRPIANGIGEPIKQLVRFGQK